MKLLQNILGEEFGLFSNPLIKKYYYEQFRKDKIYKLLFGYFLILFSAYFYIFNLESPSMLKDLTEKTRAFHFFIIGLQIVLYFLIGFNNVISAIVKEKDNKTFEFLKTLPLTYKDILFGKLIGPNLTVHFFQILTIPIFFVSGIIAGVSLKILLNVYVLLFVGGFTLHFLGLFLSTFFRKQSNSNLFLIIFIFYGLGFAIAPMQLFYKDKFPIIYFLGIPITLTFYFVINCIFLIKVFSVGILQKLKNELDFPFSRIQALVIFITFCFLSVINMGPELTAVVSSFGFYFLRVPVLFLLCLILTPDYAATLNWLKYRKSGIKNFLKDGLLNSQSPIFVFVVISFLALIIFTFLVSFLEMGISKSNISLAYFWELNKLLFFHNLLLLLLYLTIFQYGVLLTKENSYATGVKVLIVAGIILTLFFPKHLNFIDIILRGYSKHYNTDMGYKLIQPIIYSLLFCLFAFYLLFLKYKYLSRQISK